MKDYYAEFLQTKNSGNIQGSQVSKVSKGENFDEKEAFDTFDTALTKANSRNIRSARERVNDGLIQIINRMIAAGASFDVAADDFQVLNDEFLQNEEREFLANNKIAVLCTFQQALLMKHLCQANLELLTKFIAKVNEHDARFEAVCEITAKWFARLLDTMPDESATL